MKIIIQPQGTLAIYEQIVSQLKDAIVTGDLKAGEALPSIRALAGDLQVSVITTKRAYEELEKEGLVRTEGTLVYTTPEVLDGETRQDRTHYYIFRRKGSK